MCMMRSRSAPSEGIRDTGWLARQGMDSHGNPCSALSMIRMVCRDARGEDDELLERASW